MQFQPDVAPVFGAIFFIFMMLMGLNRYWSSAKYFPRPALAGLLAC